MPLKHTTETFLVFALGVAIILAGLAVAILPPLPSGILPWGIAFAISIAYPLSLTSLFRKRRADYPFRAMHWLPLCMLLIAALLQIGSQTAFPGLRPLSRFYQYGWALPAVLVSFGLLIMFCVKVLRRRGQRLALLLMALVPFTALAIANEQVFDFDSEIASVLWQGDWWKSLDSSSSLIGMSREDPKQGGTGANLDPSDDPSEESWRERLRAIERRRERIAARLMERGEDPEDSEEYQEMEGDSSSIMVAMQTSSSSSSEMMMGQTSSKPSHLPQSGMPWEVLGVVALALYMGTVHNRARRLV